MLSRNCEGGNGDSCGDTWMICRHSLEQMEDIDRIWQPQKMKSPVDWLSDYDEWPLASCRSNNFLPVSVVTIPVLHLHRGSNLANRQWRKRTPTSTDQGGRNGMWEQETLKYNKGVIHHMISMIEGQRLASPRRTWITANRNGIHVDMLKFPARYSPMAANATTAELMTAPARPKARNTRNKRRAKVTRERLSFLLGACIVEDLEVGIVRGVSCEERDLSSRRGRWTFPLFVSIVCSWSSPYSCSGDSSEEWESDWGSDRCGGMI